MNTYSVMFGGEAGYGVMSAGMMVARAASRNSLWSMVVNEYPSLIKGGLNTCMARLGAEPLAAHEESFQFLGALSQQAFDQNYSKVRTDGIVLYDCEAVKTPEVQGDAPGIWIGLPLLQKLPGDAAKVMGNSALLGAFCALSGFPRAAILQVMNDEFKKESVREQNKAIFEAAFKEAADKCCPASGLFGLPMAASQEPKMLLNGNDALAMGAIQGGCRFCAGYPMTPGSSVLVYMADQGARYGVVFKQAEDEIAAVNMLIGASYAGVRSLASTSGGGFALMVEALGFAAQAELPIVLVNAQRGGPSTGMPTRTAQADLLFTTFASQGEFPRFVLAPGDVDECFYETTRLFDLTERFQVPGLILTDKYLADSSVSRPFFTTPLEPQVEAGRASEEWLAAQQPYLRYSEAAGSEAPPRAVPGQKGGAYIATSYTHSDDGFYSSGDKEYAAREPETAVAGLDRWYEKLPAMEAAADGLKQYGPDEAELTLFVWGSTKGAALETMELAKQEGLTVNVLQVLYVAPFPVQALLKTLPRVKKSLLIEGNKTAQLGFLLRGHLGYAVDESYLKYDSRAFTPSQILARIKEVLG